MLKRLVDAVVFGFGASAGKALFDEAVEDVEKATREPTPEEKKKSEAEARKRALADEKERERVRKQTAAEIDDELAALKRKLGK